ncbi:diphthamide biosynthesis enzyme Dph2 [Thermococcus gammatolerans]|uniref:2-(3-amino-3-carboxypropyl)histidine synthase n=1 Tax=Thermococcus gammatolerans (strain DSM 15229 / JCM 11827 / EJ3) TaxID=593117 RepID=C5A466_THEGJ|nr:diphthamide biosynthesis enzyme Dph2 [Thermococcus gammatolerans]ACS33028.1 Diphthamide synthesis DPH2 protein [Thermococcus gammatolerans EJ3]
MHEVPHGEILKELKKLGAECVLIQSPEGLRREAEELAGFLEENGLTVILHGEINYGACDPADSDARRLGCDALIHLGHSYMRLNLEVPTIFVPAFAKVELVPALEKNIEEIRKLGRRIALVTTAQHVHRLDEAREFLEKNGFEVLIGRGDSRVSWPGQVLGCNFSSAKVEAEGVLFIGSGLFHPLGVALATKKPTLAINPYSGDAIWMDAEAERLIRKRWAQIAKAMDAKSFGVVVSTKKGQLRLAEAKRIVELLRGHGRKARLIAMDHISYPKLEGFPFDAYVVVACPRVPIDDYENWRKPVLTPREVEPLLGLKKEYEFDEIPGVERREDEPLGVSLKL